MAPLAYLTLTFLSLLHPLPGFVIKSGGVQTHASRTQIVGNANNVVRMSSSSSSRGALLREVVGGVGIGVLGLGLATERATAYEASH